MRKSIVYIALVSAALTACQKEDDIAPVNNDALVAYIGDDTKTILTYNDKTVTWCAGDKISLWKADKSDSHTPITYDLVGGANTGTGYFNSSDDVGLEARKGMIAVYPAVNGSTVKYVEKTESMFGDTYHSKIEFDFASILANQNIDATGNTNTQGVLPMVGKVQDDDGKTIKFEHILGVIRFKIQTTQNVVFNKLVITLKGSAGNWSIPGTIDYGGNYTPTGASALKNASGFVSMTATINNLQKHGDYYIFDVLAPVKNSKEKYIFTLYYNDNKQAEFSSTDYAMAIAAGQITNVEWNIDK